jgi:hypothetical protein
MVQSLENTLKDRLGTLGLRPEIIALICQQVFEELATSPEVLAVEEQRALSEKQKIQDFLMKLSDDELKMVPDLHKEEKIRRQAEAAEQVVSVESIRKMEEFIVHTVSVAKKEWLIKAFYAIRGERWSIAEDSNSFNTEGFREFLLTLLTEWTKTPYGREAGGKFQTFYNFNWREVMSPIGAFLFLHRHNLVDGQQRAWSMIAKEYQALIGKAIDVQNFNYGHFEVIRFLSDELREVPDVKMRHY